MPKELISAYQMFLVPASILFTALGVARTEGLKSGISALGVALSVVWGAAILYWDTPPLTVSQWRIALCMPAIFLMVSIISLVVHLRLYCKGDRPDYT
jgi:hypothetical protein